MEARRFYSARMKTSALLALVLGAPFAAALADTPAFDRPGIAFSTSTLAPGTFTWEQGLPDVTYSDRNGARSTLASATTVVRAGLSSLLEVQLSTALLNHLSSNSGNASGIGDSGLAIKAALPIHSTRLSMAVLGGVGLATGDAAFSNDATTLNLATTASYALDESSAVAAYAGVSRAKGSDTLTLSPSYGFALNDTWGAYLEAGATYADGSADQYLAGGGVTWMVLPTVQLDGYSNFGLNQATPNVIAGVGVSVFFP